MTTASAHISQALTLLAVMAATALIGLSYLPDQCEDAPGKVHYERLDR